MYAHLHVSIPFAALTMQLFPRCGTHKGICYLISSLCWLVFGGMCRKKHESQLQTTKLKYVFALPQTIKWR